MRESMARRTEPRARTADIKNPPLTTRPVSGRPDVAVLRAQLVDLVRDVAIDDPEVVRRLRQKLVRAVLLWELGPEVREHPDWQPMLETIVATLEADESQQKHFLALISELKRAPRS